MSNRKSTRLEFINTASKGLGIKLTGGVVGQEQFFGIFIKRIISGGALDVYKKAKVGDQILTVNGIDLTCATLSRAVNILRRASASNHVVITFSSDKLARSEYSKFICMNETKAEKKLWHSLNGCTKSNEMSSFDTTSESIYSPNIQRMQDVEQTIEFKKSSAGIGFRVHSIICSTSHDCCKQVPLLLIGGLSRGGDAAEDGRLKVGDYLTKINGYDILQYSTDQIHSLLLREKLRHESVFQLSYIPAAVPPLTVADTFHYAKKFCRVPTDKKRIAEPFRKAVCISGRRRNKRVPSSLSTSTTSSSHASSRSDQRRLSLNGNEVIEIDKLFSALENLGYCVADEQYNLIKEEVLSDENNAVLYSDFVDVVLKICGFQISHNFETINPNSSQQPNNNNSKNTGTESTATQTIDEVDPSNRVMEELQNRVDELETEKQSLTRNLKSLQDEREGDSVRHDVAVKQLEQKMKKMKLDYDQLIKVMESEIEVLQSSEVSLAKLDSESEIQTELSLVECECRKLCETRVALEKKIETLLVFTDKISQSDVKSFMKCNKSHEAIETLEDLAREAEQLCSDTRYD